MVIEMLDELIEWGRTPVVIVADSGYGDSTTFRHAPTDRELAYVVAVKGATLAHPSDAVPAAAEHSGRDRPPTRRYRTSLTCKDLVAAAGEQALTELTWRHGTKSGPGGTHELIDHPTKRRLTYSVRFGLTGAMVEKAALIPKHVWTPAYDADGQVRDGVWVAEFTDLLDPSGWSAGMRVIVR